MRVGVANLYHMDGQHYFLEEPHFHAGFLEEGSFVVCIPI
jgi:hypothetical protein